MLRTLRPTLRKSLRTTHTTTHTYCSSVFVRQKCHHFNSIWVVPPDHSVTHSLGHSHNACLQLPNQELTDSYSMQASNCDPILFGSHFGSHFPTNHMNSRNNIYWVLHSKFATLYAFAHKLILQMIKITLMNSLFIDWSFCSWIIIFTSL